MKKNWAALGAAVLLAAAVMSTAALAEDAEQVPDSEIEQMAVDYFDQLTSLAGGSDSTTVYEDSNYEAFKSLYTDAIDDASIQSDYTADWSAYTNKDQHFATVVAKEPPYYYINVTAAISAGQYPDTHSEYSDYAGTYELTPDGLKFTVLEDGSEELQKLDADLYAQAYPEGLVDASDAGRNVMVFNHPVFWYVNPSNYVDGALNSLLRYLWVDEEGNLCGSIIVSNGTGGNRSVFDITLTLTDQNLGTIYDGPVDGSYTIMDGSTQMFSFTIPAGQVSHTQDTWGQMQYSLDHSNQ